jgi:multiple sugar transport system permease protein
MFPMPIEKWKPINRALYRASLPVALLIWLLPMLTALVTSIRSNDELMAGNYWGWPQDFAMLENYREALTASPMLHYFWNSCLITIPR